MTKQELESDFVKLLKERDDIIWYKFYHIMGRYTEVPADYIIFQKDKNILVECKECTNNRFVFERLTQKRSLMAFKHKFSHHCSYILLCFLNDKKKDSSYFLIDIDDMINFISRIGKKSANLDDFRQNFKELIYSNIYINL
jgi:hypothetical protein